MGNGMLSQEEIDALLRGTLEPDSPGTVEDAGVEFTDIEKDAIGEIANISMGTAATTLSLLLGKKVEITTPTVDVTTAEQIRKEYPVPSVIVDVKYKAGIEGSNLLILSQRDGAVIVDLMMGGDGTHPSPELTDLQISGISEAMNQMMGSAATSMSAMFNAMVDITPPQLVLHNLAEEKNALEGLLKADEPLVRISFRMVVETVIDSSLVQVIPLSVAKGMVAKLLGGVGRAPSAATAQPAQANQELHPSLGGGSTGPGLGGVGSGSGSAAGMAIPNIPGFNYGLGDGGSPTPPYGAMPQETQAPGAPPQGGISYGAPSAAPVYGTGPYGGQPGSGPHGATPYGAGSYGAGPSGTGQFGATAPGYGSSGYGTGYGTQSQGTPPYGGQATSVQPAQFVPLQPGQVSGHPSNLDLILDVPLQVSVELGKAKKTIREILEMGPGSVIELDRLAGEAVDMIVNGKLIAKCEVVVINETFGIRITDIVNPAERMQGIRKSDWLS